MRPLGTIFFRGRRIRISGALDSYRAAQDGSEFTQQEATGVTLDDGSCDARLRQMVERRDALDAG